MIINYKDSPTGKAWISDAKEPFMPTPTGIGYLGCIIESEDQSKIQCFECGKWLKKITKQHRLKCNPELAPEVYKEKFGLFNHQGLASTKSIELSRRRAEERIAAGLQKTGHLQPGISRKIASKGGQALRKLAYQNQKGTCPEQLKETFRNFIRKNLSLPNDGEGRSLRAILSRRFGNINGALDAFGLPTFKRTGTRYKFTNGGEINSALPDTRRRFWQNIIETHPFFNQNKNVSESKSI